MRVRALLDPRYHNFPYSFDDAILATEPIIKPDGYKMFQLSGEISGRSGFFQIGVTIESVIEHRVFKPY